MELVIIYHTLQHCLVFVCTSMLLMTHGTTFLVLNCIQFAKNHTAEGVCSLCLWVVLDMHCETVFTFERYDLFIYAQFFIHRNFCNIVSSVCIVGHIWLSVVIEMESSRYLIPLVVTHSAINSWSTSLSSPVPPHTWTSVNRHVETACRELFISPWTDICWFGVLLWSMVLHLILFCFVTTCFNIMMYLFQCMLICGCTVLDGCVCLLSCALACLLYFSGVVCGFHSVTFSGYAGCVFSCLCFVFVLISSSVPGWIVCWRP